MSDIVHTKNYKTVDNRVITFTVTDENVSTNCGVFKASYKHNELNFMLEMHSKILTSAQIKDLRKFITESREPPQMSLF